MAAMPITLVTVDHSAEIARTRVWVEKLDATNFDELYNAVTGKVSLLQAAFLLITRCVHVRTTSTVESDVGSATPPDDEHAQREIAIRVSYVDTVTAKKYRFDIPGPIDACYPATGTDVIPLGNVEAAAFILVFEANALSPDGNAVQVTGLRLVGKNT
jgi:hypothetical protein